MTQPAVTIWKMFTVERMRQVCEPVGSGSRYEVVKTYNPNGFFKSGKHYAQVDQDGSLKLMTEVQARMRHGEDLALYGYVACDAAWRPMQCDGFGYAITAPSPGRVRGQP